MLIEVKVHTSAKHNKIEYRDNQFEVYLTCAPEKGKANKKIIQLLADYFSLAKANISIIKGEKSRYKLVRVDNLSKNHYNKDSGTTKSNRGNNDKRHDHIGKMHCWER